MKRSIVDIVTGIIIVVLGLAVVGIIVAYPIALSHSRDTISIHVQDRERGSDSKPTLVFADDETFKVGDSLWAWHFDSSDTYRQLKPGGTYTCHVQGWRIPFFSAYRNIIRCLPR